MKLIMESWRKNVITEAKAIQIHEELIQEFVNELKVLTESKAELNEILAKVGEFAKKAYNTYSDLKKGAIKKVLETAINGALKVVDLIRGAAPNVASKVERVLNELKKAENMTVAVSLVSIIIGLATGDVDVGDFDFEPLEKVINAIQSAPNLIKALETVQTIKDTAQVAKAVDKAGKLVDVASAAE